MKSYQQWLNELNWASRADQMIEALVKIGQLNPDKKAAQRDAAFVLVEMYNRELSSVKGQSMAVRTIEKKFEGVTQAVFKKPFSAILNYVNQNAPSSLKPISLGYIKPSDVVDSQGRKRVPLGFMKKPKGKVDNNVVRPNGKAPSSGLGLGFLED